MADQDRPTDPNVDGRRMSDERIVDRSAIADLVIAYAHAVDDRDWVRWERLFVPTALIDYRSSGGIVGSPAELSVWMPEGLSVFTWTLHSISAPEIRFVDDSHATGRVHLLNRNGVEWEGRDEILEVDGMYHDEYVRVDESWRFASRVEHTLAFSGGKFADVVRRVAADTLAGADPVEDI